ncbi:MAG: PEGA domain-containing protein [Candidatus Aenigmarchaeota archaeon]|nr:PEGA domain-containing protein [Candidatus Aenigmarchaeota archaeon]
MAAKKAERTKRKTKISKRNIKTKRSKTKTMHSKTKYNIIIAVAIIAIFLILFGIIQAAVMVMPTGKYTGPGPSVGWVLVKSDPSRASLTVNNIYRGLTPMNVTVPSGQTSVRVEKPGYRPYFNTVMVYPKKSTILNVILVPIKGK